MPLTSGTRLGAFEILALVGAGGMGEVYRARDTRLDRTVAGVPITVTRVYDSRVRTARDFGVGWSLDVKTGSYQNNRSPASVKLTLHAVQAPGSTETRST